MRLNYLLGVEHEGVAEDHVLCHLKYKINVSINGICFSKNCHQIMI